MKTLKQLQDEADYETLEMVSSYGAEQVIFFTSYMSCKEEWNWYDYLEGVDAANFRAQKMHDVKVVTDGVGSMAAVFVDGKLFHSDEARNVDINCLARIMNGKTFMLQSGSVLTERYCHNGSGAWRWKKLATMERNVEVSWNN